MWKTIFQPNEWPKNTREFTRTYYRGSMPGESRKRPNSSSWRRPAELGPIVDHPKVILIEQWPALPLPCKSAACQDSFRASQSRIVFANSYRAWQPSHLRNTWALLSWSSCLRVETNGLPERRGHMQSRSGCHRIIWKRAVCWSEQFG